MPLTHRVIEALDIVYRAKKLGDYDCNVIGMAAEIVAEELFGMKKSSKGKQDIDGVIATEEGVRTLQVKAWSDARVRKYKGGTFLRLPLEDKADDLLLILFYAALKEFKILYHGPTHDIGNPEKNGKTKVVRLDSLLKTEALEKLLIKANEAQ